MPRVIEHVAAYVRQRVSVKSTPQPFNVQNNVNQTKKEERDVFHSLRKDSHDFVYLPRVLRQIQLLRWFVQHHLHNRAVTIGALQNKCYTLLDSDNNACCQC
jgi:hypothetical protein